MISERRRPPLGDHDAPLSGTGERPALALFPGLAQHGTHDDLERVYTPDALARFCVGLLPWTKRSGLGFSVLEPHAGGGAFLRALLDRPENIDGRMLIQGGDIDPDCWAVRNGAAQFDFLDPWSVSGRWNRVIGNPPFDAAEAHVDRGLEVADEVAFLLPLSRLDAAVRAPWWQSAPVRHEWRLDKRIWPGSRQIGFFWFDRNVATPGRWTTEVVSCP